VDITPSGGSPGPKLAAPTSETARVTGSVAGDVYLLTERISTDTGNTNEPSVTARAGGK
jgi:hypothetical protein